MGRDSGSGHGELVSLGKVSCEEIVLRGREGESYWLQTK